MMTLSMLYSVALVIGLGFWGKVLGSAGSSEVLMEWLWFSGVVLVYVGWESVVSGNVLEVAFNEWFLVLDGEMSVGVTSVSGSMVCLMELVSTLVVWYSLGYMSGDVGSSSLLMLMMAFKLAMLVLVTSSNFLMLFMGWEGVGIVSFLLMTYWYTSQSNGSSGMQAMLMNKVGDIGMLLGIGWFWGKVGGFEWAVIEWGLFGWVMLVLVVGSFAKSGQVGLHLWLPNAMAAPTPMSALLHSATMVTAGVYLGMVLGLGGEWMVLLSGYSLLLMGCMGLVEYDYKRIMAYSTGSQLGYMLVGVGMFESGLGYFHLLVHGLFKSTLFLSSGLVLYMCSDEQDIRKLGGLRKLIPMGYVGSLVGTGSLLGLPSLSGYYSKEYLMMSGWLVSYEGWWLMVVGVGCTSYYSVRVFVLVYLGTYKGDSEVVGGIGWEGKEMYWVLFMMSQLVMIWGYVLNDLLNGLLWGSSQSIMGVESVGWVGDLVLFMVLVGGGLGSLALNSNLFSLSGLTDGWGYERFYKELLMTSYTYGEKVVWLVNEKGVNEALSGWGWWQLVEGYKAYSWGGLLWAYVLGVIVWVGVVMVG